MGLNDVELDVAGALFDELSTPPSTTTTTNSATGSTAGAAAAAAAAEDRLCLRVLEWTKLATRNLLVRVPAHTALTAAELAPHVQHAVAAAHNRRVQLQLRLLNTRQSPSEL